MPGRTNRSWRVLADGESLEIRRRIGEDLNLGYVPFESDLPGTMTALRYFASNRYFRAQAVGMSNMKNREKRKESERALERAALAEKRAIKPLGERS